MVTSPHAPPLRGSVDVLVPEALALRAVPMCAGTSGAAALSPEGANSPWGGPAGNCCPHASPLRGAMGNALRMNWGQIPIQDSSICN